MAIQSLQFTEVHFRILKRILEVLVRIGVLTNILATRHVIGQLCWLFAKKIAIINHFWGYLELGQKMSMYMNF